MYENDHDDCNEKLKDKDQEIDALNGKIRELRDHIEELNTAASDLYNLVDTKI
jgi:uncharacterized coiled-coil DUF342 family protein